MLQATNISNIYLHSRFYSSAEVLVCKLCVVSSSELYQPREQVMLQNIKCEGAAVNVLSALISQICLVTVTTACHNIPLSVCGDHLPSLRVWSYEQICQGAISQNVAIHQLKCGAVCMHAFSWPPLPRTVCECLCPTRLTSQWCQSKSVYTVSYYGLAGRRWCASCGCCGWTLPVGIEIIQDCICKLHICYSQGVIGSWVVQTVASLCGSAPLVFSFGFFSLFFFFHWELQNWCLVLYQKFTENCEFSFPQCNRRQILSQRHYHSHYCI